MTKYETLTVLRSAIAEVSPDAARTLASLAPEVISKMYLIDLGVNSIDYAEVAYIVMDKLGISQSIDIFSNTNRIGDLVEILYGLRQEDQGDSYPAKYNEYALVN